MKIEIPEFKEFPDSNISGRIIVNPYWLEYLLNLFFQGYLEEVWEEIMDMEMNHYALIENGGYGIIGKIIKDKKCIFWKDGKCNSDYAKGLRCGGYVAIPKDCPYNKKGV